MPQQKIRAEQCGQIRDALKRGTETERLVDRFGVVRGQILYHARGDCTCDTDIPPADVSPGVSEVECQQMRRLAKNGNDDWEDLSFPYSANTKRTHATGRCDHDIDEEPYEIGAYSRVTADECEEIRKRAPDETYRSIAEDLGYSRPVVGNHARAECTHDVDVEPIDPSGKGRNPSLSAESCYNANLLYWEDHETLDTIMRAIKENTDDDVSEKAVKHHIYNECSHWSEDDA